MAKSESRHLNVGMDLEKKEIFLVKENSYAAEAGIQAGESLLTVNGQDFTDLIDLSFLFADECLRLELLDKTGQKKQVLIEKGLDEEVGLEFTQAVFDQVKECHNGCIFCFVDQMAPNMRDTLYIKDDDYRLSFLFGNFITLTNLTKQAKERIKKLHLSPLYVSVQATEPNTRSFLLKNKRAGELLATLQELAQAGIEFHTQIVLCPGLNDGEILAKSYRDLAALAKNVLSVAVVPVGLTKFAPQNNDQLRDFTRQEARQVVEQVAAWQKECRENFGRGFIYAADEFFVLAKEHFPASSYYDGYCQYENGIGICRKFIEEWYNETSEVKMQQTYTIICGQSAEKVLKSLVGESGQVLPVVNTFFGSSVTVTGLLTGQDIIAAIEKARPEKVILPGIALKSKTEQVFLDDLTLEQLKERVNCKVEVAYSATDLKRILSKQGGG